ncbi:MAG: hypothetical protein HZA50_18965 [Planctomycetes bacterium]|nr:hypothetical protein [Planctomycetota bacterium]
MEFIRRNLFENPVYIYVFLGVCGLALLAVWHERRDKKFLKWLAVPAGLAGAVWLVSALVVTDREEIHAAMKAMAKDAAAGRSDAFNRHLADDFAAYFEGARIDKKIAISIVEARREGLNISGVAIADFDAIISADTADTPVTTKIVYGGSGQKQGSMIFISWQFRWAKRQDGWVMTESLKDPEPTVPTAN